MLIHTHMVDLCEAMCTPGSAGTIGHVAHGKSTVVKAISGVQTVRFKNELERNITIKLGYANAKVYRCKNPKCPRSVPAIACTKTPMQGVSWPWCRSPAVLPVSLSLAQSRPHPGTHMALIRIFAVSHIGSGKARNRVLAASCTQRLPHHHHCCPLQRWRCCML